MTTTVTIRPIQPSDDVAIAAIIQQVGQEFGAVGEGFGPSDDEVQAMSQHYSDQQQSRYWVAEVNNIIVGGVGVASFAQSNTCCELKKLFILPEARGKKIGKQLVKTALDQAIIFGYRSCYLDTLASMKTAIQLYCQFGFEHLTEPLAASEHNGCDVWMLKHLV